MNLNCMLQSIESINLHNSNVNIKSFFYLVKRDVKLLADLLSFFSIFIGLQTSKTEQLKKTDKPVKIQFSLNFAIRLTLKILIILHWVFERNIGEKILL